MAITEYEQTILHFLRRNMVMLSQEYKSEEEYWIKHPISFDKQEYDKNSKRCYGNIVINKALSTVTYVGDPIDYRLLIRILYIDKDVRRTLKKYLDGCTLIPENSISKPTISEVELCPDVHSMWYGEMTKQTYEVDPVNIRKRKIFTIFGNTVFSFEPVYFNPIELLMLFKVMDLKARKQELSDILKVWRFRYNIPENEIFIFESDDDLRF